MKTKYIIVTGGELFNKGAQSMSFITISEMRLHFPNHEVLLISERDYRRAEEEKKQYGFRIIHDVFKSLLGYGTYAKLKKIDKDIIDESKQILRNTDFLLDISGYALGSNWKLRSVLYYLSRIRIAKKHGIKVFLMPQSYGPFDYPVIIDSFMKRLIKDSLKRASKIYARENEGFNLLTQEFNLDNVELSPDLVLQNKEIDLKKIYNEVPGICDLNIENNSVAIVPNMKNFRFGNISEIISLYEQSIKKMLEMGLTVYLLRHSYEDIEACEMIKEKFKGNDKVFLLSDEYSCFEYESMVKKFKFIIASRYHSIIHAYKNGIPCIALGWAVKYHELLKLFGQEKYIYDVRGDLDFQKFIDSVQQINDNHNKETALINKKLAIIQQSNIFDSIDLG